MINGVITERYVYFDEIGNIEKISNHNNDEGQYVKTSIEDVYDIMSGIKTMDSFFVIFDSVQKKHIIKSRFVEDEIKFNINDQIYKIPQTKIDRPDLTVKQNILKKQWDIELDPMLDENIKNRKLIFSSAYNFSVCGKNDPHNFYQYFQIDLNNIKSIPFVSDYELDIGSVSVYTTKRLDTYYHEVIND